MKKILILSVSAGQGHVRAAEALRTGTERWFGGEAEARHIDLMDLTRPWFRTAYKGSYMKFVNRYPALWGFLYNRTDRDKAEGVLNGLRRKLESHVSEPLLRVMKEYQPDIVLSTHFLPGQVLGRWRRKGRIENIDHWIVVTDFLAHRFWLEPGQTGYFTATEENAFIMRRRGLEEERIELSGIPIMPEFSDSISREEGAAAFGLDPARTTVLLMAGGEGLGLIKDVADELSSVEADYQLAVLAGRNQKLLAELKEMAAERPSRLAPLGFTTDMPKLLAASDLVVTKPGGLTTCECLAMGKPMIVVSPIPGQEEANCDYLLEHCAAWKASSLSALVYKTLKLINDGQTLEGLGRNAAAIGKPFAARSILETILAG
ncbi:galactosyldiacylglycerol synthase [Deltaproteobacteria bacterium Smac51]|nr:galactosyldiacylglycerol synthase [Deltaproteobacteria bacterium Smac51]UQZ90500.1 galactosyldiacylglycerol synthase [Deltaproteobacteria bacterium Smac51]